MTFVFVSGRPSLDFVGTLKWRRRENPEEQLAKPVQLSDWARAAGLVIEPVPVTPGDLSRAVDMREALYRIVSARVAGRGADDDDIEVLNSYARRQPVTAELLPDGRVRRHASTVRLLASVALDTLGLLAGSDIDLVTECADPDCTRLYVDTSRTRNRRWCGMVECGNRAKAQAFRQRQKASPS